MQRGGIEVRRLLLASLSVLVLSSGFVLADESLTAGFTQGNPGIQSMSTLEFGPDAVLFIGDSKSGAVFAVDTDDRKPFAGEDRISVPDVEGKIAALLGAPPEDVLIHDLAVNPISKNAYLSVSRGRTRWDSKWKLPNELEDARIILRIHPDLSIDEFELKNVRYAQIDLPNPVDMNKEHQWKKGAKLRSDAITDVVYDDGTLYISGLSNEEFAAAMWQVPFPAGKEAKLATVEIFHGAHGEYETHAPIRTFLMYEFGGEQHIIASYLCTPLVTFRVAELEDGQHVKGNTVAEFGSGNFPLDMVLCQHDGKEFIVMSNSMLPLMTFSPQDVGNQRDFITKEVPAYTAGVSYVARSGSGVQQLDAFNDKYLLALQRMPNGKLDVVSLSLEWLAQ
jgi:hypothetical protein